MKINISSLILFVLLNLALANEDKLKIGIKKRVENCTVKSKKGDLIHVHYRVSSSEDLRGIILIQMLN